MTNDYQFYQMPNLGCQLGKAYQRLLSQLASALAKARLDVTTSEYLVLRALYTSDGLQPCEIAALLSKDKAAVSRSVTAMAKKGLVVTEPVSHKCLRVFLSEKGRGIEPEIMKVSEARHQALVGLVNPEELKSFVKVLNLITNQTDK
ncbi:MAG: MarR family winged helix-turn-helix transcriptional regulator [Duncaniella sp.]|nr:MarR family winged helix-turn-helix transcriptional regulator [Duncaniella sp.]